MMACAKLYEWQKCMPEEFIWRALRLIKQPRIGSQMKHLPALRHVVVFHQRPAGAIVGRRPVRG